MSPDAQGSPHESSGPTVTRTEAETLPSQGSSQVLAVLGSSLFASLPHDIVHTCGFKSLLSADSDSQEYPWPGTPPSQSWASLCLLAVSPCMPTGTSHSLL